MLHILSQSPSLERLEAELGRSFQIGLLNLPRFEIVSFSIGSFEKENWILHIIYLLYSRSKEIRIDTSMWYGCFYHAQNGELKRIVNHGCPR